MSVLVIVGIILFVGVLQYCLREPTCPHCELLKCEAGGVGCCGICRWRR